MEAQKIKKLKGGKKKMEKCQKCGYEWEARSDNKPVQCPRCKRYDWEKPSKQENEKE